MKRRNFIKTAVVAAPMVTIATIANAEVLPSNSKGFVVKAGEDRFNEPIKYRGINPNCVKVSGKDTGSQFSVFEYEGFAKIGPELHLHTKQDETFYVLEGNFLFQVGEEKHKLATGDTIFLPRNIPHTWLQVSDKGKLMYMLQPAGKMEEFFKKINLLQGRPTAKEVQKIHIEHDMKIVGPPLASE
jgi:quercetin 2,3-dioxygenase